MQLVPGSKVFSLVPPDYEEIVRENVLVARIIAITVNTAIAKRYIRTFHKISFLT